MTTLKGLLDFPFKKKYDLSWWTITFFVHFCSEETEHSWLPPLPETVEPGDET